MGGKGGCSGLFLLFCKATQKTSKYVIVRDHLIEPVELVLRWNCGSRVLQSPKLTFWFFFPLKLIQMVEVLLFPEINFITPFLKQKNEVNKEAVLLKKQLRASK